MKLKNIVAALTFVVALGVSTSVYAATEVKLGQPTDENGNPKNTFATIDDIIKVPIQINTTDDARDMVGATDFTIEFNKNNLYYDSVENGMVYRKYNRTGTSYTLEPSGSVTLPNTETANANGKFAFNWVSTSQTKLSDSQNEFVLVMYPQIENYTFDPADIKVKVNQIVATDNLSSANNVYIYADELATYLEFEVPKEYDKWIHEVHLVLDSTDYKLDKCIETETGYKFIVSIKNSTEKKSAAAKVVLKVADTEDATVFESVDFADLGTIQIEKF